MTTAEIIDPTSNKSHHHSSRHESTWKAFQYYLDKCIPVKVHNVSQFRLREDDTDDDANHHDSNDDDSDDGSDDNDTGDSHGNINDDKSNDCSINADNIDDKT